MKKTHVLFVCLGNICRSPLAEAIFKHKIKAKGLDEVIEADSCGTSNYHIGDSPDPRTMANARRNGISIEHCGRQLSANDLNDFDFILAMDRSNYQNILRFAGEKEIRQKLVMMRDFDPVEKGDVPDPYHGGEEGFQAVHDILDRSIEAFITYLRENHLPKTS